MTVSKDSLVSDILSFLKDDLSNNINDPISSSRSSNSKFILTSYPNRAVQYPIVTLKCTNIEALRAGMQTTAQDITITLEIRVWARNEKEKDTIYTSILNRLADIQFTSSTGSVANLLFNQNTLSSVEVDEPGESGSQVVKSRILQCQYNYYG